MILYVLIGVLALAVAGCACVVWASRGGPRWVRAIATVTLLGGEAVRAERRRSRRWGNGNNSGGGSD
ncbi:hypothetical protein ACFV2S_13330 [Streptomyces sp. NPDC059695]|uniref:hypothetical protein n=1 Tax=Streptomyces sp. NPDC059695 TaxID=3346910 RepID=UPI0036998BF2